MLKFNQSIINFLFMKKILLFFILFFISFFNVYWAKNWDQTAVDFWMNWLSDSQKEQYLSTKISTPDGKGQITVKDAIAKWYLDDWITGPSTKWALDALNNIKSSSSSSKSWWPDDLTSTDFIINVDSISPWINSKWSNTTERVNWILWTLIQNMMIWLWILSVLIMTIWSGYIIFHNWQDELLSKGKSIFMSWVYAMIIALTSYYLISIVRYMLYS